LDSSIIHNPTTWKSSGKCIWLLLARIPNYWGTEWHTKKEPLVVIDKNRLDF
jgi:hypothetical protein